MEWSPTWAIILTSFWTSGKPFFLHRQEMAKLGVTVQKAGSSALEQTINVTSGRLENDILQAAGRRARESHHSSLVRLEMGYLALYLSKSNHLSSFTIIFLPEILIENMANWVFGAIQIPCQWEFQDPKIEVAVLYHIFF